MDFFPPSLKGYASLERRRKESSLNSAMRALVIGDSEKISGMEDVLIPNECLQLVYHRAVRRHLLLLYPKEILIMDLGIKQVRVPCEFICMRRNFIKLNRKITCFRQVQYWFHLRLSAQSYWSAGAPLLRASFHVVVVTPSFACTTMASFPCAHGAWMRRNLRAMVRLF